MSKYSEDNERNYRIQLCQKNQNKKQKNKNLKQNENSLDMDENML
jgi:hypothetical protein